jgi:hypothetical protein
MEIDAPISIETAENRTLRREAAPRTGAEEKW